MELETGRKKKTSRLSSMLGPGFRFHPTDEELVQFYLRRKASGKSFQFDAIADVDVYKTEPWDLPCMSKLKSRDLEWYFFSFLDKKYGNGARTNRATGKGYWKTTGKDRAVYHKKQIVGMKKTLVYHCGRAPKGERSNWVMHEYRLVGCELEASGVAQDSFVICRIFQKSGTGPKNGEQYGAPFEEEEWDNDELELVPQFDAIKEVNVGDNSHLNSHDFHQILESDAPLNTAPPISPQSADDSCNVEASKSFGDTQSLSKPTISYDPKIQNSPISNAMDDTQIQKSGDFDDLSFLLNDPFLDSFDKFDDGFIETNDLSNPFEAKTSTFDMLDEYLDAGDDTSFYFSSDPAMNFVSNQTFLPQMGLDRGSEQANFPSGQIMENVSRKLGNINAPPAFAAEFPSKDAIVRLNSVARSTASGKGTRVGFVIGKAVSAICRGWLCFIFLWILMSFRGSTNIGVK